MRKRNGLTFAISLAFLLLSSGSHVFPQRSSTRARANLTGTWNLDASRSDDVRAAIDQVVTDRGSDSDRVVQRMERRLQPPNQLAIEESGRRITIGSSSAPQVSFEADGLSRTETSPNGRPVQTTATLTGSRLTISTEGDRGSDFIVTFEPLDNGRSLQVTRRIQSDQLSRPIEVKSFYSRVSDTAQLERDPGVSPPRANPTRRDTTVRNSAGIPDGTTLTAVLNEALSTKNAADGDRFTMTVRSPSRYDGATLEGRVSRVERSGRVTGNAELGFSFERIRLRDGGTYNFAGVIEQVKTPDNEKVSVNNEGGVKDKDGQTRRTATRTGIGAAVGAIIGGIAGGGKGAGIGAAVGAGAGAGSVIVEGRDDLNLERGTEFTIQAS